MQTSEHLIAYQTVSFAAYQRLRETLMQQTHVFKTVITDAQTVTGDELLQEGRDLRVGFGAGGEDEAFVLMSSPMLNVLLTAVPIKCSERLELQSPENQSRENQNRENQSPENQSPENRAFRRVFQWMRG